MVEQLEAEVENKKLKLEVLENIKKKYEYEIIELYENYAKIKVDIDKLETLNDNNIIFEAEIYKVANFAALASINDKNYFVVSSYVDFLTQIDINSKSIYFEANALHDSLGKREISVKGFVDDIQIFNGDFGILKLDHRSNIKLK